jgi:hypothetical protein
MLGKWIVRSTLIAFVSMFAADPAAAQGDPCNECMACPSSDNGPNGEPAHKKGPKVLYPEIGFDVTHVNCDYRLRDWELCGDHEDCVGGFEGLALVSATIRNGRFDSLAGLLDRFDRKAVLNVERSAIQLIGCGGGVAAHFALSLEQKTLLAKAIAKRNEIRVLSTRASLNRIPS